MYQYTGYCKPTFICGDFVINWGLIGLWWLIFLTKPYPDPCCYNNQTTRTGFTARKIETTRLSWTSRKIFAHNKSPFLVHVYKCASDHMKKWTHCICNENLKYHCTLFALQQTETDYMYKLNSQNQKKLLHFRWHNQLVVWIIPIKYWWWLLWVNECIYDSHLGSFGCLWFPPEFVQFRLDMFSQFSWLWVLGEFGWLASNTVFSGHC